MKTEIFATFGPACGEEAILEEMIDAGMTGMRLNLSHTTLPNSMEYISAYQKAAQKKGIEPQILIDMQGPELRVGRLKNSIQIEAFETIYLCTQTEYEKQEDIENNRILVPTAVLNAIEIGDQVLLDDGKLCVEICEVEKNKASAKVLRGGKLQSHKSIKVKDKNIKMPPLTEHDIENIKVASNYGVTALMQPFVHSGEELRYVRDILKMHGAEHIKIYAKIENKLGVQNIQDILPEANVIIIARGDLGNDMPLWELPKVQKQVEQACKKESVPYVVVTQMLASMEESPVPTRAEVSDIYHAVYHGAWGVMITGETAVGKYPVEAVRYLANTAKEAEEDF